MHVRQLITLVLLLSSFFAIVTPKAHATTINVPADKPTIQAAIDSSSPGDTVSVSAGTYLEHLTIRTSLIRVVGASRDSTIIDGQGTGTVVWVNASNVEFSGFTVRNPPSNGWAIHA